MNRGGKTMKKIKGLILGLILMLGIASSGFAGEANLTLDQAQKQAKAEPSYRVKILEEQIKQAEENFEDSMEESVKAAKRNYANEDDWSGLSIQNQRAIYLMPLNAKEQVDGLKQQLEDLKTSGEDQVKTRYFVLADAQAELNLADLQLELAKMNQASAKIRYANGSISLMDYHDASYALLNQERSRFQAQLKVVAAGEKFNQKLEKPLKEGQSLEIVWGALPMMPRGLANSEIDQIALGTDRFRSAISAYQKTVLEIRAIEEGFRGPKFETNRPEAYPQYLLSEIEEVGKVVDAMLDSKAKIKERFANLQDLNVGIRQDAMNCKNREQERVFVEGKLQSGQGSQKEVLEAKIGVAEARLRYNRDRLAYEQAVEAWNRDLQNWGENLSVAGEVWNQALNAYVANWKYDPESTMDRIGKAYTDWILSAHGISPSILEDHKE
jgi:hypothetical protein